MIPGITAGGAAAAGGGGGAGVSLVGMKTQVWNAADTPFDFTGLTGGSDAQAQEGDYCLIYMSYVRPTSAAIPAFSTIPDGQVSQFTQSGISSGRYCSSRMYAGFIPAGALPTGLLAAHTYAVGLFLMVFRGVDPVTPLDVAFSTAYGNGAVNPNPPSITPVTAGAMIVIGGAMGSSNTAFTDPADFTDVRKYQRTVTHSLTAMAGLKRDWAAGAFDPAVFLGATQASNNSWNAFTAALRPA